MKLRSAALTVAMSSAFALTACGGNDEKSSASETSAEEASPQAAITEIAAVKAGLDTAVEQVRSGDPKAAEETVSNTYVDHFEKVEGPLDKVDHELNEELEEGISTDLRKEISDGASAAAVSKHVDEIKADLDTAAEKLK
jgi:hypothetical protein